MLTKLPKAMKCEYNEKNLGRSNLSTSRINQRISNSPLKVPLQNLINKAIIQKDALGEKLGSSRILFKSRIKQDRDNSVSRYLPKNNSKNQQNYFKQRMHTETSSYLRKYFSANTQYIPAQSFIGCVIKQYEHLWGTKNSLQILEDFNYKIIQIFGDNISVRQLVRRTETDGMIGLILQIFKQIKNQQKIRSSNYNSLCNNPKILSLKQSFQQQIVNGESIQNMKNIIQQFMQTMYQCMETQIYNKFNIQMRRMVIKYREAEKLVRRVNEKINMHADIFCLQIQFKNKRKQYQIKIEQLRKHTQYLQKQLYKQKYNLELQQRQNSKLEAEIIKLKQNLQKFQNVVLNKVMETSAVCADPMMSRRISTNSMISDKENNLPANQQPFKITIDTHVVHKQGQMPETKTYATIYNTADVNKQSGAAQIYNTPNAQSRILQNELITPYAAYLAGDRSFYRANSVNQLSRRL